MALRENVKVVSGNRVTVEIEGTTVGMAQNVRMSDNYNPVAASEIGNIKVVEWVPTQATHSLTVSLMVLYTEALKDILKDSNGSIIENGDAVLRGQVFDLVVRGKSLSKSPLTTVDQQQQQKVLKKYIGCSYASGDVSVDKHQIVMTNVTLNALDVTSEE